MNISIGMKKAIAASEKGTCKRRKIGSAFYDEDELLLSIGHNGPEKVNCFDNPCPGADVPAGSGGASGLSTCHAIHAEARALSECDKTKIKDIYSTKAPCPSCVQLLLTTPCKRIYFLTDSNDQSNKVLWVGAGREWIHVDESSI